MSPTKISGLPLGTVTSDDYLVYVDRNDNTTKKAIVSSVSSFIKQYSPSENSKERDNHSIKRKSINRQCWRSKREPTNCRHSITFKRRLHGNICSKWNRSNKYTCFGNDGYYRKIELNKKLL